MQKSNHERLRAILRANPQGMTTGQIVKLTGVKESSIRRSLQTMPDTYVAGWDGPVRGQYCAIYRIVVPPPNVPRPAGEKRKPVPAIPLQPVTRWAGDNPFTMAA